jgi:hypothetical protein
LAGNVLSSHRRSVLTGVTGALTTATHSGNVLVTSGSVTVPNAAGDVGFHCMLIFGGAHTITFNSTVCAAMASGDVVDLVVQSTTVIKAVRTTAANHVTFT